MTYNAAHRKPSRWGRVRGWLAGWLDRLCGEEWVHGLSDGELAEEFPEDLPRPDSGVGTGGKRAADPVTAAPSRNAGPGQPWEPPERQVVTAILKDGVYLLCTGGPPVDLRKWWVDAPRLCRPYALAVTA